ERPGKGNFTQFGNGYLFKDFAISPCAYSLLRPLSDAMPDGWMPRGATWECLQKQRIRSGLASIPNEIGPDELPQEGRLEVDAIDFDKGCYLGQEVMARIHAMGRVRRLTVPVSWNGQKSLSLPTSLFASGKKCGILKSLVVQEGEKSIGMALIHENGIDSLEGEGLTLEGISEGRIQPL
ncbi:MAG: tRNA-modifying protein YgfZ, partial [Opitutae bacterium]|nr:tRNA-modifying protein YgfZ [Opitutae bacterium]